ncbi:D-methionine transport system permease protein [Clostridium acidisoli DSM 12555]|jgi:D-methionine transport system permease protein|uniref:D-methionine transport system permease protein n=1 Tax=Clostridium acidisoli DSM 12555 TaxID=1121291 RepID=A0A1W1XQQ3_9CLOT|nr:methionine ABC transporter permease [Clostridium acidisoli]SMC26309.1 D-methionine transport system permease protein [Clostridium acidisoli DSM 12555]
MISFLNQLMPNVFQYYKELGQALVDTLYMVSVSGIIGAIIGIPAGVALVVTRKGNILENKMVYSILGTVVNILRAIPFVILLTAITPVTRFIVGTTIGTIGAIVPLIFAVAPFIARQIESTLLEVDSGVIEAAKSMGSSPMEIIFRVLILEGLPGVVYALTIAIINLISYSAVAGTVGGGGLGDFAIRYGYQYFKTDIMVVTIIILLIIVNIVQFIGEFLMKKLSH